MKENNFRFLKSIIKYLISIALIVLAFVAGYMLVPKVDIFKQVALYVYLIILVLFVISSVMTPVVFSKKNRKDITMSFNDENETTKEEILRETIKAGNLAIRAINGTYICAVFVEILFVFAMFSFGVAKIDNIFVLIAFMVLSVFLTVGIINLPFKDKKFEGLHKKLKISKDEYPLIFKTLESASKVAGIKNSFLVYLTDRQSTIIPLKNKLYIFLNPTEVKLYSKDQLYSVALFNFGKYANMNIRHYCAMTHFLTKFFNQKRNFVYDMIELLPVGFMQNLAIKRIDNYHIISTFAGNIFGDDLIIQNNCSQDFVNATAKQHLFAIYDSYYWKEIVYDAYQSEMPLKNHETINYLNFIEKLKIYEERWTFTLKNELSESSGNVSLKDIMDNLNIENFDYSFENQQGQYLVEQDKIMAKGDKTTFDFYISNPSFYNEIRTQAFVERKQVIDEYENADKIWNNFTDEQLITVAQAYFYIDDQKALSILNELLEKKTNYTALHLLGYYQAREYDDDCIPKLKSVASSNSDYSDSAFEILAEYAIKTGNQQLLDEVDKMHDQKFEE